MLLIKTRSFAENIVLELTFFPKIIFVPSEKNVFVSTLIILFHGRKLTHSFILSLLVGISVKNKEVLYVNVITQGE